MKDKKGFTLIELLAVVIILGILTFIAIPAISGYIDDTKKSSYITTAKAITAGVGDIANSEKLDMNDILTTYYIPVSYVNTENELTSPYGDFTEAYVGVITDRENYSYYWVSRDSTGVGVKNITPIKKLSTKDLEKGIPTNEISEMIRVTGIGNRHIIKILNTVDGSWETITLPNTANNIFEDGSPAEHIGYPIGKTRETVQVGDVITIGNEQFHLIRKDGNDLVLFAKYNLKVGDIYRDNDKIGEYTSEDEGYGLQSSEAIGFYAVGEVSYGVIGFSDTNYWSGKVGAGKKYPGNYCGDHDKSTWIDCAYIYDSNSKIYPYVNAYKEYLESLGVNVKSARIISLTESSAYEALNLSDNYKPTYALGSAGGSNKVWIYVGRYKGRGAYGIGSYTVAGRAGVRPIIVV